MHRYSGEKPDFRRVVSRYRMGGSGKSFQTMDQMDEMCEFYGIELDHHKADSDSRAAAEILLRYMRAGAVVEDFVKEYRF